MNITAQTHIQLTPGQSASVLGTETIVLNYETGTYFELNEVGGFIWKLLQTSHSMAIADIEQHVLNEFDVTPAVCYQELMTFLADLSREKLIQVV